MPILDEALARMLHSDPMGDAFDVIPMMVINGGSVENAVTVVYIDLDGNRHSWRLTSIRDAAIHNSKIHAFWMCIEGANRAGEEKDSCYQQVLDTMNQEIGRYGTDIMPTDLRTAMNEIEVHLNQDVTVW